MTRRLLLWIARAQAGQPRAVARLDRLQLYAAGMAGCAAGYLLALLVRPAVMILLAIAGNGWR